MKKTLINLIFPRICVLCGAKGHNDLDLCSACRTELPMLESLGSSCKQCGQILRMEKSNIISPNPLLCGACLKDPPAFLQTIALFQYRPPIDYLILNLKFNHQLHFATLLGNLMAKQLLAHYSTPASPKPEVIIPVPLHKERLKERGFNQASELAKPIAKLLNIPVDKYSFLRTKNTQAQSLLKIKERQQNIKHAFTMKKNVNYQSAAVIDDVITTGNTTREFCKVLQKVGIARIDVWSAARAHLE